MKFTRTELATQWRAVLGAAWGALRRPLQAGHTRVQAVLQAVHAVAPDFWTNLQQELVAGRQWLDRAVVLAYAVITGLVVVGFTALAEFCFETFLHLRGAVPGGQWWALAWTPAITVAVLWWMRRHAAGALGSGIPQVVRALEDDITPAQRSTLVSLRLSLHKIFGVSGSLLAGLSVGREGPTVQVGAGVMHHARRWLSPQSGVDGHDLMVAGAAAGIAATFNTPLGGVIFAMEELSRRRGISHSALVIAAIVVAGLVSISVFGNETYFGKLAVQQLSWSLFLPGLAVVMVAGLAGGLFSRLVAVSARGLPDRFSAFKSRRPIVFGACCAFAVAVIGLVTGQATAGAGYGPTHAMLEGRAELPGVFTLLKFCATWLSAWSGMPAGVFAPSLSIGAGIGHDLSLLIGVGQQAAIPLIALGMVAFLSATTQAPITAFILVMEMISGQTMVLSLMASALLASGVSRLMAKPLYEELAHLLLGGRAHAAPAPQPVQPAQPPAG